MRNTQISVFLENRPGRLAHFLKVLSDARVNLQALSVADTADFGIARVIVGDLGPALRAISAAGLTAATTTVLQVEIPDEPGALAKHVVDPLAEAEVNIEYTYAYREAPTGKAIVVLKVDKIEAAEKVLARVQ